MLGEGNGWATLLKQQACLLTPGCTNMAEETGSQAKEPGDKNFVYYSVPQGAQNGFQETLVTGNRKVVIQEIGKRP